MKKIYSLIITSAIAFSANAVIWDVAVSNSVFTPNNLPSVNIGDQVRWTLVAGVHTTTSLIVPGGAATWDSGTLTATPFLYNVTVAGNYGYQCTFHGSLGMVGGFTVLPAGINDPSSEMWSLVYPNPCMDKITIKYKDADQVIVYDMLGNKVKSVLLNVSQNFMEIEMATLPQGVYFFRTMKEGEIVSTRKVVKA